MSHELRTPLNNLLILARCWRRIRRATSHTKQVKFAETIHSSGTDLLSLINDILDLSKIESGTMAVEPSEVPARRAARLRDPQLPPRGRRQGAGLHRGPGRPICRATMSTDMQAAPAGAQEPALQRPQIHRARQGGAAHGARHQGLAARQRHPRQRRIGHRLLRGRHRHRHSRRTSSASSSRPSSRPTAPPAASTAAPAWACPSAAKSPTCWAAKSGCTACPAWAAPSPSTCRRATWRRAMHRPEARAQASRAARQRGRCHDRAAASSRRCWRAPTRTTIARTSSPATTSCWPSTTIPPTPASWLDAAHEHGYKALVATRGDMGLAMARKFRPSAVLLDIGLPDTTGWSVLDQLQHDPDLRHVPVHVLSIYEDRRRGLELGRHRLLRARWKDAKCWITSSAAWRNPPRRAPATCW